MSVKYPQVVYTHLLRKEVKPVVKPKIVKVENVVKPVETPKVNDVKISQNKPKVEEIKIVEKEDDSLIVFPCPHCNLQTSVFKRDINCGIFRHAVWKKNNLPIPPHAKKEAVDNWLKTSIIVGCGKQFKLKLDKDNKPILEKCENL